MERNLGTFSSTSDLSGQPALIHNKRNAIANPIKMKPSHFLDRNHIFVSNMFGVVLVLLHIAAVLPLEIHFVLFYIGGKHVVRAHAEHLRHADEKMKQVN